MNTMLWDPMIVWPDVPTISYNLQYFIEDGIIIYGGTKGPFKLNGEKAISTTISLIHLLRNNNKNHIDFINYLFEMEDGQYLIHLFTILNKNGCVQFKDTNIVDNLDLGKLNSFVNNYKSEEEIIEEFKNTNLKINTQSPKLKKLFCNSYFNTEDTTYVDWEIKEINNIEDIINLNSKGRTIIFANTDKGLIIGPIISEDAVEKELAANYYKKFNFKYIQENSSHINLLHSIVTKVILKLGDYNLEKGLYTFFDYKTEFIDMLNLYDSKQLSLIEKFDLSTDFSSSKYANKSGHFAHYKASNVKLSRNSIDTEFFYPFRGDIPKHLSNIFKYLGGYKDKNPFKKYVPTGGNINSNLLFYINYEKNELNGIGMYIFDNVNDSIFQINDHLLTSSNKINQKFDKYKGLLLIGSDVDVISQKYNDFGFKIANLNTGIVLATFLALKDSVFCEDNFEFIEKFDENYIVNQTGMSLKNIIINLIIGVKK